MEKFAISQNGKVNQRLVFNNHGNAMIHVGKNGLKKNEEVVGVWVFNLNFRLHDEKDFVEFASAKFDIEEAVQEAMNAMKSAFAVDSPTFGIVAKYGSMTEEFKAEVKRRKIQRPC